MVHGAIRAFLMGPPSLRGGFKNDGALGHSNAALRKRRLGGACTPSAVKPGRKPGLRPTPGDGFPGGREVPYGAYLDVCDAMCPKSDEQLKSIKVYIYDMNELAVLAYISSS